MSDWPPPIGGMTDAFVAITRMFVEDSLMQLEDEENTKTDPDTKPNPKGPFVKIDGKLPKGAR